nr:hypothetical protein Iba_chr14bCG5940 [Ipomoea batatas]
MVFHNAENNNTDNQQHALPTRESVHVPPTDPYVFGVFENSINTTLTIYNNSGNLIKANCSCNTPLSQLGSFKKGSRRNSTNTLPLTVIILVQSMPPISSQVLADTPTNLRDAINLTSSVNTTGQACRARSSQPFQVNTTNCHAIGQLRSQNLTTGESVAVEASKTERTGLRVRSRNQEFSIMHVKIYDNVSIVVYIESQSRNAKVDNAGSIVADMGSPQPLKLRHLSCTPIMQDKWFSSPKVKATGSHGGFDS